MFNKRLIQEFPDIMKNIYQQVFYKWINLIISIIITFLLSYYFVLLIDQKLIIGDLYKLSMIVLLLLLIKAVIQKTINSLAFTCSSEVKIRLREKLFDHICTLGISYKEKATTSELVQLSIEGINQLDTYFSLYLPQLFYSLLSPLTLFVIIFTFDKISALVLLVCVPLIPLSIILVQKLAKRLLSKYWTSYTTLGDSFLENLQGLTTLQIYQSDEYKHKKMNEDAESFRKITMRVLIMQLNSISIMDIVAYAGAGLGGYFAFMHFFSLDISLKQALFIVLIASEFFIPLRQLGSYFHIAMNGMASSDKIFKLFDQKAKEKPESLNSDPLTIEFKDLSFSYDQQRTVLKNITLKINEHQFIGITGQSGSGKSTLAKLIIGQHNDYSGNLFIQNKPRNKINDQSFFKRFIYICHEPMIFKGTVKDNLCLYQNFDEEKLISVLKKVCLYDFFTSLDGLNTEISENGNNLSGGQKQRLNLARALLHQRDIYIFDEATSNIDADSENIIIKVIEELSKEKTVIMITHRLSNLINCDHILLCDDGKIIEEGNHETLLENKNIYYKLWKKQSELEVYNNV